MKSISFSSDLFVCPCSSVSSMTSYSGLWCRELPKSFTCKSEFSSCNFILEFFNFPTLFSESSSDIIVCFNFWRLISDPKVELSIPLVIESANSADSAILPASASGFSQAPAQGLHSSTPSGPFFLQGFPVRL